MAPTKEAQSFSTAGTVSSPLDLASLAPKGEHEQININGNSSSSSSKKMRPKPKVTLTSLTINNVGHPRIPALQIALDDGVQTSSADEMGNLERYFAKDQLCGHTHRLL